MFVIVQSLLIGISGAFTHQIKKRVRGGLFSGGGFMLPLITLKRLLWPRAFLNRRFSCYVSTDVGIIPIPLS